MIVPDVRTQPPLRFFCGEAPRVSVPPTTSAAYTSEYTRAFPSCCLETSPWSGSVSRNAHAGPERRSHRSSRDGRLTWRSRREAGRAQPEGAPYGPDPNGVQTPRFLSPAFDFLLALTGHPALSRLGLLTPTPIYQVCSFPVTGPEVPLLWYSSCSRPPARSGAQRREI